ncbi:cell envelope biogenesis protein OmpA [Calothrix sp. 336/3]|nr:cell envelope biogenesis protein OmpA [Calothrix sp. 336/3]
MLILTTAKHRTRRYRQLLLTSMFLLTLAPDAVFSQSLPSSTLQVVVNSNQDRVQPDGNLTLREAIQVVNGTLPLEKLSQEERKLVTSGGEFSQISFNLPPGETTIAVEKILPPLGVPRLLIDGTTQPGYEGNKSATAEIAIPTPIVSITTAPGREVLRGLTVTADRVTIRGLSIYGFTSKHGVTESTPPADIFISHRLPPPDTTEQQPPNADFPYYNRNTPPQNVVIENNWLGITPEEKMPEVTSAFGVSVFNGVNTTISRNRISYHDGSGIITSVRAEGMQVVQNIIVGNGLAGMPDGIRLDGVIDKSELRGNLICANDGSGVFLFKPQGSVTIRNNNIKFNGRRFRRAAVYLMGSNHQVKENQISYQSGAGVVITSYPQSDRNTIQNNSFFQLEGLSIDLNAQHNVGVQDFQNGDGVNPPRNSPNRKRDTANAAINTPKFLSPEFLTDINPTVGIDGIAEPDSQVDIYKVTGNNYGALTELLGTTKADNKGKFSLDLANIQPGDRISAISTHPDFGTSEPSYPAIARTLNNSPSSPISNIPSPQPQCLSSPPAPEPEIPPEPIRLQIPKNIHFALDKDYISPESAKILDKIAQAMGDNPTITAELLGHTDIRASDTYNINLAARRAKNTRNYLIKQGIAPERMTIRSLGERQLQTPGTSKLDHARNRRVEFIFQDIRGIEVIVQESDLQLER